MSMRDVIKEAFSSKKSNFESKWDYEKQPNLFALDKFLRKSGYRLVDAEAVGSSAEIFINAVKSNHLTPPIHHDMTDGEFYVTVEEYGLINASDLEEIVKGYTHALAVIKYLNSLDLSKLEVERPEEDEE